MAAAPPRIALLDYLPDIFRAETIDGADNSFVKTFLTAFDAVFEQLQAEIEGTPPAGTNGALDPLMGGIPDLFHPDTTPPAEFTIGLTGEKLEARQFAFLEYLAGWIGLPLRREKPVAWNRAFFKTAIAQYPLRGTLQGMDALLRAWLAGDLASDVEQSVLLTDLTLRHPDADTLFMLRDHWPSQQTEWEEHNPAAKEDDSWRGEPTLLLGVTSALGEGPPFFFLVDLPLAPTAPVEQTLRAARQLLDAEKPANTYYQLRVRSQSQPDGQMETWTYDSDQQ